jgi:replication factor C subunit 1
MTDFQDIVITGNVKTDSKIHRVHKVLRPEYKLLVGTECNDGRPITESWRYKQAIKLGIPIANKRTRPMVAPSNKTYEAKEMFVDKYSPKSINDIIGHKEQINQITNWLQLWDSEIPEHSKSNVAVTAYPDTRGIIVTGPPGVGKTTTIHLIANSLGYHVTEYNASDTRSVSTLRGLMAFGIKRLRKEIIVMDEVDGLSERGGVGEIATIIKKTNVPIICIANDKPPKLRPILNVCHDIKFNRPVKSTIASALLKVAKEEGIDITKVDLEGLCEKNGNDIRSILNNLEFFGKEAVDNEVNKDATLRLDLFSATQKLFSNKKSSLDEAANLVFVDYNMVPLMVQEAYVAASKNSLDEVVKASEHITFGDIMDRRIHQKQDWNLLPHFVQTSVAATRSVTGAAPFQIFPQWLGKNSKRLKHRRYMDDLSMKVFRSNDDFRLDYAEPLQNILLGPLQAEKPDIKCVISTMDTLRFTRDNLMENLQEVLFDKIEIPTKVKTAFTREYNKTHTVDGVKLGKRRRDEEEDDEDGDEECKEDELEKDIDEVADNMNMLGLQ